ncbi:MAG: hypothetical protein M1546_16790 [Chloroflexi bacterium]|nr:hypothetical protein [Chloroflexota bacterium]
MYHDTTRATLIKRYGLPENDALDVGVLLGALNPLNSIARWQTYLSNTCLMGRFDHVLLGECGGVRIGFAVVYGPTFAADFARIFQILGAKTLIQIGAYGGLQPEMRQGDILVPTESIRQDGASDAYLPDGERLYASEDLSESICAELRVAGATCYRLPQLTICGGVFSETEAHIRTWGSCGYGGVDLETAATFAIAQRFGLRRAAILVCSDVIAVGNTVFHERDADTAQRYQRGKELIHEVSLRVAVQ